MEHNINSVIHKHENKGPYWFLDNWTIEYDEMTDEQKDFIDFLEPLNIEARYPTTKEKLLATT